ncbi:MAG: hypothetical protein IH607_02020 [Firmicutes bacterium]|nr:hypothetical protein [Bacillota bacterium]
MQENEGKTIQEKSETVIDPIELIRHLLSHIGMIIFVAIVCMGISGAYTFYYVKPIYESTAKLYVLNSGDSAINLSDLQVGSYLASDYIEVFKTWEVHQMVIENLDLPYSSSHLQDMLFISNPSNTRILYITVRSTDPHEAMLVANEYAKVAILFISKTMATEEPNIMSEALEPIYPSSPKKTVNLLLGFMIGLALSAVAITIRFVIDDKVKTADDIRKYSNLSVLAVVPTLKHKHMKNQSEKRGRAR